MVVVVVVVTEGGAPTNASGVSSPIATLEDGGGVGLFTAGAGGGGGGVVKGVGGVSVVGIAVRAALTASCGLRVCVIGSVIISIPLQQH